MQRAAGACAAQFFLTVCQLLMVCVFPLGLFRGVPCSMAQCATRAGRLSPHGPAGTPKTRPPISEPQRVFFPGFVPWCTVFHGGKGRLARGTALEAAQGCRVNTRVPRS